MFLCRHPPQLDSWRVNDFLHQFESCIEVAIQKQKEQMSVEQNDASEVLVVTFDCLHQSFKSSGSGCGVIFDIEEKENSGMGMGEWECENGLILKVMNIYGELVPLSEEKVRDFILIEKNIMCDCLHYRFGILVQLDAHLKGVNCADYFAGGDKPYLITGSNDHTAKVSDGERLHLAVKELGTCDLYPQSLKHNPNGTFVVVCGDGKVHLRSRSSTNLFSEALATLILNKLLAGIKVCTIKAPGFGENRKSNLQDLSTLTGGEVITDELGMNLDKMAPEMLGNCKRVVLKPHCYF
ncbi:unnamed protein product [Lactuca saligna]|uniref:Uncharacterized protein n=1 Tax=Lactuca saligna TaxID=75948 RepID=A0AA36EIW6_LACSI|nr:unnamed protein product [Lactuca saligna]